MVGSWKFLLKWSLFREHSFVTGSVAHFELEFARPLLVDRPWQLRTLQCLCTEQSGWTTTALQNEVPLCWAMEGHHSVVVLGGATNVCTAFSVMNFYTQLYGSVCCYYVDFRSFVLSLWRLWYVWENLKVNKLEQLLQNCNTSLNTYTPVI